MGAISTFFLQKEIKFVILLLILAFILYKCWWKVRIYLFSWNFPGPYLHIPFIGSLNFLLLLSKDVLYAFEFCVQKYGTRYCFWIDTDLVIFTCEPKDVEVLCNNPKAYNKPSVFYDHMKTMLGDGLVTESLSNWVINRKLMAPSVKTTLLNSFFDIVNRKIAILMEKMNKECKNDNTVIDMLNYLHPFTINSYTENFMEINFDDRMEEVVAIADVVLAAKRSLCDRMTNIISRLDLIYFHTKKGKIARVLDTELRGFLKKITKERQLTRKNEKRNENRKDVLLPLLLDILDKGRMTNERFEEEVLTMFLAGTDTTAITISFACILLGMNPQFQEKMYEEIMEVVGSKTKSITLAELSNLKYVERVTNETLRLFPTVPQMLRNLTGDIQIGDLTYPTGVNVMISIIGVHRNEKYWPNPMKFDPDRFLPEECAKRPPGAFIPFSLGPRKCLGLIVYGLLNIKNKLFEAGFRYAMQINKLLLANIVRNFTISTIYKSCDEIKVHSEITLGLDKYPVILHSRK